VSGLWVFENVLGQSYDVDEGNFMGGWKYINYDEGEQGLLDLSPGSWRSLASITHLL